MPRYFIDIHNGTDPIRDEVGFELADLDAARAQAMRIMRRIAEGIPSVDGRQDYVVAVREAEEAVRLRLRLSLDSEPV